MVASAIVDQNSVLPELGVLIGQNGDQLVEVGNQHGLVSVGLSQRNVGAALSVEGADNVDVLSKISIGLGVFGTSGAHLRRRKSRYEHQLSSTQMIRFYSASSASIVFA